MVCGVSILSDHDSYPRKMELGKDEMQFVYPYRNSKCCHKSSGLVALCAQLLKNN